MNPPSHRLLWPPLRHLVRPADDIVAYLENPQFNTLGLSVPGMVQGSPGMETGKKEDYQVVAFSANGQQSVFREYKDY